MNFSDNLKKIRKEHNLSQEQIAEQLGVSRQSVSKWESGQAYPEMDKMLQLCKMFNLNIDDLLNQDVKEINNNKQAKNNINKFVDDFLDYITKTIDMFSSMKFKQKVKCLFEQILIAGILTLILLIIGAFLSSIFSSLFSFIPPQIYYPVFRIFKAIYLIFCLILGITLILHIFKIRYLDYYIIIKDNPDAEETIEKTDNSYLKEELSPQKILLEKKKEKIIIRDPNHSGYKFISGLLKCLLFFIKTISLITGIFLCMSLIFFIICLVLSFLLFKTGLLFIGLLLILLSSIIINIVVLIILYNFIISKRNKKSHLAISFMISLILFGTGIGLITIDILNFNIVNDLNSNHYKQTEYTMTMTDNLYFEEYHVEIDYIESDNEDIKIQIKSSDLLNVELQEHNDNSYYFNCYLSEENFIKIIRQTIKDINNKEFIDYSNYSISIYTTKENIQKLKQNLINKYEKEAQQNYENTINQYERRIDELETRICELEGYC